MEEKEKKLGFRRELNVPDGVSVNFTENKIIVEKSGKKIEKHFLFGSLKVSLEDGKVIVTSIRDTKREKTLFGTLKAILNNLYNGTSTDFIYKLKICSGHFPMNVSISGKEFLIKNFLGEAFPRKIILPDNVSVKIDGEIVNVKSYDKELAGRTASMIEKLTKIKKRDKRIFQDGVYIIQKHNKNI